MENYEIQWFQKWKMMKYNDSKNEIFRQIKTSLNMIIKLWFFKLIIIRVYSKIQIYINGKIVHQEQKWNRQKSYYGTTIICSLRPDVLHETTSSIQVTWKKQEEYVSINSFKC